MWFALFACRRAPDPADSGPTTPAHSSSPHETNILSRTNPALFTTASRRPNVFRVASTSACRARRSGANQKP